jgi:hypothetical protein
MTKQQCQTSGAVETAILMRLKAHVKRKVVPLTANNYYVWLALKS